MAEAPSHFENATLNITQEIRVEAPLETTFAALLEQLGPGNEHLDGTPMPLKLEVWPGGRWFRDLGDENGHFWGNVQAVRRPTLLEICGPLFMSAPVANNVQYRLDEQDGVTIIRFRHSAFGMVPAEQRDLMTVGWTHIHQVARKRAEAAKA